MKVRSTLGDTMAINTFQASVRRIRDLTHDVRELELGLREPKDIAFKAGQFISFEVTKEGLPFPLTRPYSIASPPLRRQSGDVALQPGGRGARVDLPVWLARGRPGQLQRPSRDVLSP